MDGYIIITGGIKTRLDNSCNPILNSKRDHRKAEQAHVEAADM